MPRLWIIVCILFIACSAIASEMTGKAVGIADSDEFTLLLVNNTTVRIRLHDIDTPAKYQAYSNNPNKLISKCINDFVAVRQIDGCYFPRERSISFFEINSEKN
jgi:hypothetical protein